MRVDNIIRDAVKDSDVAFGSDIYSEIAAHLAGIGLNLAFFVFTAQPKSSCASTVDGVTLRSPVLDLYLAHDADVRETGIDPRDGNWNDEWNLTHVVRNAVNGILQRHGFNDAYISNRTFVFVRSLEELALREIGRECKAAVRKLICDAAPGVVVSDVYWNGQRYDVILRDKTDYKRVNGKVRAKVADALPELLAAADTDRCCRTYKALIQLGHDGMNLWHVIREDLGESAQ